MTVGSISRWAWLAALAVACWPRQATAQEPDLDGPGVKAKAEPADLRAPRVPSKKTDTPATVAVVDKDEIQRARATLTLGESLARVSGVFVQNDFNFAQDARIAIRGFGARAAFGIRGLTIVVDEIPETLADGQSQVDSLDLGSAESIEVMRGPASALYGNAAGGVVVIRTESGPAVPFVELRTDFGRFRQLKQQIKGGGHFGRTNLLVNLSNWSLRGFRDHSDASGTILNGKLELETGDESSLTVVLTSVYAPRADDAGGLTAAQLADDRRQAAPINLQFDTGESVTHGRLGLVYERSFGAYHAIKAVGFTSLRDFDSAVPFRTIAVDRFVGGASLQYRALAPRGQLWRGLFVGIDMQLQRDQRQNRVNMDGQSGDLILDQRERVSALAPYAQLDLTPLDDVIISASVRGDLIEFDLADRFGSDGDASGSRTFTQASGRVGVVYNPSHELGLYAHAGQAFETPTTTELTDPDGGLDPAISPQRSWSVELGARGGFGERLEYSALVFRSDSINELVRFEDEMGRTRFRNAGESRRLGAETDLSVALGWGASATLGYSWLRGRFTRFDKDGVDLSGNWLPGLPRHRAFAELGIERAVAANLSWFVIADGALVGRLFADDENAITSDSHLVANARGGITLGRGRWRLSPYVSVRNLARSDYNANVRINAFGGRFFEPAPPASVFAGATLRYSWERERADRTPSGPAANAARAWTAR